MPLNGRRRDHEGRRRRAGELLAQGVARRATAERTGLSPGAVNGQAREPGYAGRRGPSWSDASGAPPHPKTGRGAVRRPEA